MSKEFALKYKTRDGAWRWKAGLCEVEAIERIPVVELRDSHGNEHPEFIVSMDGSIPDAGEDTSVEVQFDEVHFKTPLPVPEDGGRFRVHPGSVLISIRRDPSDDDATRILLDTRAFLLNDAGQTVDIIK